MTQQEWEPGTVAMVTDGRGEYLALRRTPGATSYWVGNVRHATDGKVTSVRPLLVLDPDDPDQMRELERRLSAADWSASDFTTNRVDAISVTVRAMLPKPTPVKPAEPAGLGAVVEDIHGYLWTRFREHPSSLVPPWIDHGGHKRHYADIEVKP